MKPNKTGYWWAEQENGKQRVFQVVVKMNGETVKAVKVLHKDWRTVEQIEESFGIVKWTYIVPPKVGK